MIGLRGNSYETRGVVDRLRVLWLCRLDADSDFGREPGETPVMNETRRPSCGAKRE